MKRHLLITSAIAAALSFMPGVAAAQTADASATAADTSGPGDIVVTAQRREQSAQDVGIALSVLGGDELKRRGVDNLIQLQYQTPSLEVTPAFGGGQPQYRLRGVGFEDYATNNTPTVGIYVDEVAFPVPVTTLGVLYDISRVEVLRGPQGTLYGRNTTGGAINFITNKPTDTFQAGFSGEYGRFDLARAEGYVSGPLSDTLKVRLSGTTEQGGGFQHNRVTGASLGDADRLYGRALLEWTPAPGFDVLLNVHAGRDKSEATGLYLFRDFQTHGYSAPLGPVIPADNRFQTGWGFSQGYADLTGADADDKPHRDNHSWGVSTTINAELGANLRLTSITAYDRLRRREYNDWDASASHESDTFWGSNVDVLSQETRLAPIHAGRLEWVAGAYYSYQKIGETFVTDFTDSLGFFTDTHYKQTAESISGFGQGEYKLSDSFSVILGGRYEHEDRHLRAFATQIIIPPAVNFPTFTDGNRDTGLDEFSGKAGVELRAAPGILLYANASRGVKSGGFTAYNSPSSRGINAFRPEVLYAYEAGLKTTIGRTLTFNASGYYYDYHDQQVLGLIVDPAVGAIGKINNAKRSEIYGGEAELTFQPIRAFRLTQSLGYKFGRYKDYTDIDGASVRLVGGVYVGDTVSFNGRKLPFANWSYQGSGSYTVPVGGYGIEFEGNYSYRDDTPSFLGPLYTVKSFWLANATVTFRPDDGRWYIGAYGRNIFDEHYDLTRNYFLPNASIASPGRPASYGVRAGFNL